MASSIIWHLDIMPHARCYEKTVDSAIRLLRKKPSAWLMLIVHAWVVADLLLRGRFAYAPLLVVLGAIGLSDWLTRYVPSFRLSSALAVLCGISMWYFDPAEEFAKVYVYDLRGDADAFHILADAGERLIALHEDYEQQPGWDWVNRMPDGDFLHYPHRAIAGMALRVRGGLDDAQAFRVKDAKLNEKHGELRYNEHVQVVGILPEVFRWDISGKHALYSILKYYGRVEQKVAPGKGEGIVWDPNKMLAEKGDYSYIVDLIAKVAYVSIETQKVHREIEPVLGELLM